MHDPLQEIRLPLPACLGSSAFRTPGAAVFELEIEDDVLANTEDAFDTPAGQHLGHGVRRRFERLPLIAEPSVEDTIATQALVDSACDGFNFRQFRHAVLSRCHLGSHLARSAATGAALDLEEERGLAHTGV